MTPLTAISTAALSRMRALAPRLLAPRPQASRPQAPRPLALVVASGLALAIWCLGLAIGVSPVRASGCSDKLGVFGPALADACGLTAPIDGQQSLRASPDGSVSPDGVSDGSVSPAGSSASPADSSAPPACTIEWTGKAGDGKWETAENWSLDRAPTEADEVCIAGDATVELTSATTVAALTVGREGESTPTLAIATVDYTDVTLHVTGEIANYGMIALTSATTYEPWTSTLEAGTIANAPGGAIEVLGEGGGGRVIDIEGPCTNEGAFDARYPTTLEGTGTVSNSGTFTVGDGVAVNVSHGEAFEQLSGGSVSSEGSGLLHVNGALTIEGGTMSGNPVHLESEGTLAYTEPKPDEAGTSSSVERFGGSGVKETLSGDVPIGSTLSILTTDYTTAELNAASPYTNYGTIVLTSATSYEPWASALGGAALTNAPGGTLEVRSEGGGGREISAALDNEGTFEVENPLSFGAEKASNGGVMRIADGVEVSVPHGGSFEQASGGSISVEGSGLLDVKGALTIEGGTMSGNPVHLEGEGTLAYTEPKPDEAGTSSNVERFAGSGVKETLSGDVPVGSTLSILTTDYDDAELNTASPYTNYGTIVLTSATTYAPYTSALSGGALTNAPGGTIEVRNEGGGGRKISAALDNEGTFEVENSLSFGAEKASNGGVMTIADGVEVSVPHGGSFEQLAGGSIETSGSGYLDVSGTIAIAGGTMSGNPVHLEGEGTLAYTEPKPDEAGTSSNVERFAGSGVKETLSGDVPVGSKLSILTTDYDDAELNAASPYTNYGTIVLTSATSYEPYTSALSGGALTNAPGGTIEARNEGGGGRAIEGLSANEGTLKIASGVSLALRGKTASTLANSGTLQLAGNLTGAKGVDNSGTIEVAPGVALTLNGLTNAAGASLDVEGSLTVNGEVDQNGRIVQNGTLTVTGGFTQRGGSTSGGQIQVSGGMLAFDGTGQARFLVPAGGDPSISGDIAAGQSLTIDDTNGVCGGTVVNATGAFTNAGTLEFTGNSCGSSAPAELTTGAAQITNTGTIAFDATSAGAGEIDGPIENTSSGTISVEEGGAAIVTGQVGNEGAIGVDWGKLSLSGGLSNLDEGASTLTGGSYSVLGSSEEPATLEVGGGEVKTLEAALDVGENASFEGSLPRIDKIGSHGTLTLDSGASAKVTAASLENAGSLELKPGAALALSGYTQDSTGSLALGVAGAPGASGALGSLTASGKVSLAGTLAIAQASGFTPSSGAVYTPIEGEEVTGTFSQVTGVAAGNRLAYGVSYKPSSVALEVQPGVDLAASYVSGPSSATMGEGVTVGWTVSAEGRDAPGSWTDAVYLSPTGRIGPRAVLLGTATHTGGLSAGSSYSGSLSASVPGVLPGSWKLVVRADANGGVADVDQTDDTASSADIAIQAQTLAVGGAVSGTVPANGDSYVEVQPTPESNLKLTATFKAPATGALYAAFGRIPSPGDNDAQPRDTAAASQSLTITNTQAGDYFLDIDNPTSSAREYTLEAGNPSLSIAAITPQSAAFVYDAEPGECGGGACKQPAKTQPELRTTIDGAGFSPQSTATLQCSGLDATIAGGTSHSYEAQSLTYAGPKQLYADFGPVPSPTGQCALTVKDGASSTALADALVFEETTQAGSEEPSQAPRVSVMAPSVNRPRVDSEVVVDYSNPHGYPIPAPLMELEASGATLHYPDQSAGDSSSLPLLGASPSGDPGVLAPGQSGSVELIFDSTLAIHEDVSFTVKTLSSPGEDAKLGALLAGELPAGTEEAVVGYVKEHAPSVTYEGLQALLDADASYLASIGEPDTNAEDLLAYELNKVTNYGMLIADHTDGPFGAGMPGLVDKLSVDSFGNATLTDPSAGSIEFAALPNGEYEAPAGVMLTLTGDASSGWVLEEPDEGSAQFDAAGQLTKVTDGSGNITTYSYTGAELTGVSQPNGDQSTISYDGSGHVTSIADSRTGRTATFAYDGGGRLSEATEAGRTLKLSWNDSANDAAVDGTPASMLAPGGVETSYSYDAEGRLVEVTRSGAKLESLAHPSPMTVQVTGASGGMQTESLDAQGRPVRRVLPDGTVLATPLNSRGEPSRITLGGASVVFGYDSTGALTSLTDPAGKRTAISSSAPGMPTRITRPDGLTTIIARNAQQQATSVTDPAGNATSITYDSAGLPTSITDRDGQTAKAAYDSAQDLTELSTSSGKVALSYDSAHNLVSASDANGTTSYGYDANGRVTSVTYPTGLGISFTYDSAGRRASETTSDGYALDYHYDDAGELASVSSGGKTLVEYAYDAAGRLLSAVNGNGTKTTYGYDSRGRTASVTNTDSSGKVSSSYAYTRDAAGRATAIAGPSGESTYAYDAAGELTGAALPGGRQLSWSFDAAGNRTASSDSAGSKASYTLGSDDEYLSDGSTSYTYDRDGRLLSAKGSAGTTTYTWTPQGRLASASGPEGEVSYTYDALGNLVAEEVNGKQTDLLPDPVTGTPIGSYTASGAPIAHYPVGDGVIGQAGAGGSTSYFGFDGSGDVVSISDPSGAIADSFEYLPFGQLAGHTGSDTTPFRYGGRLGITTDPITGFTRNGVRRYDPATGRFISQDSALLGAEDPYEYASNDPLDQTDLSGNNAVEDDLGVAEGFAQGVEAGAATLGDAAHAFGDHAATQTFADVEKSAGEIGGTLEAVSLGITAANGARTGELLPAFRGMVNAMAAKLAGILAGPLAPVASTAVGLALPGLEEAGTEEMTKTLAPVFAKPEKRSPAEEAALHDPCMHRPVPPGCGMPPLGPGLQPAAGGSSGTRGSHDPNEMIGPAGYGKAGYLPAGTTLPYEVEFSNSASASLPAAEVTVSEPLSSEVDLATFSLGSFGFGHHLITPPQGLRSYQTTIDDQSVSGLNVKVKARLDTTTRTVKWTFSSIDPATGLPPADASAGFLAPDENPPQGEGFASYTVDPAASARTGTAITANATVVFDANSPMSTETVTNTIDGGAPSASVEQLPGTETGPFTVSWGGSDDSNGSGIASYDVEVSEDGGPFEPLQTNTTSTSTTFTGTVGHTYAFAAWATDHVGNVQAQPTSAQAQTTVEAPSTTTTTSTSSTSSTSSSTTPSTTTTTTTTTATTTTSSEPAGEAHAAARGSVKGAKATIALHCSGEGNCKGVLELEAKLVTKRTVKRHGRRHVIKRTHTVSIGHAGFSIAAGGSEQVQVHLSAKGRALLRKARKRGLELQVGGGGVAAGTVVLRPARHRRH